MAASLVFGVLNLSVAALSLWLFRERLGWGFRLFWAAGLTACVAALAGTEKLVSVTDAALFEDEVIFAEETPYQRVVVTRFGDRHRLFLNGAIQFDSYDEHRYHESLVHPAMSRAARRNFVLILGGGDGMALREVLRWNDVDRVVLVDLDPRVTEIFRDHPDLAALNKSSFSDPRVEVLNTDAWLFAEEDGRVFDVAILDLPDPNGFSISKLYSVEFYSRLFDRLSAHGVFVTQAGSPLFAREAFWSVEATLRAARNPVQPGAALRTTPYRAYVPSFGEWGFVMAAQGGLRSDAAPLPDGLKYFAPAIWPGIDRVSQRHRSGGSRGQHDPLPPAGPVLQGRLGRVVSVVRPSRRPFRGACRRPAPTPKIFRI